VRFVGSILNIGGGNMSHKYPDTIESLEDELTECYDNINLEFAKAKALLHQAVSLKRIADKLDRFINDDDGSINACVKIHN
jgi:hypothetical protein